MHLVTAPPRALRLARQSIWRSFFQAFESAYAERYDLSGRHPFPRGTRLRAERALMPDAETNALCLDRLLVLSRGGRRDVRERIARLFASAEQRSYGIDLLTLVDRWESLASDETYRAAIVRSFGRVA